VPPQNHEVQIYFVFLSVGKPKTVLKGGYSGWRGGSSLCKFGRLLKIHGFVLLVL